MPRPAGRDVRAGRAAWLTARARQVGSHSSSRRHPSCWTFCDAVARKYRRTAPRRPAAPRKPRCKPDRRTRDPSGVFYPRRKAGNPRRQLGRGAVEGRASASGRRSRRHLRRLPRRGLSRIRAWRAGAPAASTVDRCRFSWRGAGDRRIRVRCSGLFLPRRGAPGQRAGQYRRSPGALRFPVRLDRQPVAAGDRHFHRRRRPGVRPSRACADRDATPGRIRGLGRGGAGMAPRRTGARSRLPRPPLFLGGVYARGLHAPDRIALG